MPSNGKRDRPQTVPQLYPFSALGKHQVDGQPLRHELLRRSQPEISPIVVPLVALDGPLHSSLHPQVLGGVASTDLPASHCLIQSKQPAVLKYWPFFSVTCPGSLAELIAPYSV